MPLKISKIKTMSLPSLLPSPFSRVSISIHIPPSSFPAIEQDGGRQGPGELLVLDHVVGEAELPQLLHRVRTSRRRWSASPARRHC